MIVEAPDHELLTRQQLLNERENEALVARYERVLATGAYRWLMSSRQEPLAQALSRHVGESYA